MKIVFTICSNNYLAQAKALGDSLVQTNPDYLFFIGLVDHLSHDIDYEKKIGHPIILSHEIGIPDFDVLWKKYDIIELNTCVKPFFLEYFTKKYTELTHLMYFDPDTYIFGSLLTIENELSDSKEIIITPHITTPIPLDGKMPNEQTFLNYGIYNLGFIGIKNPSKNIPFFKWWGERTHQIGYNKVCVGLFVDQLWINLIPLFLTNAVISRNLGLNMAPWNLHERALSKSDNNKWMVNNKYELIFYHFSNYKYNKPNVLASYYDRFSFNNREDLVPLYDEYNKLLIANNIEKLSTIICYYVIERNAILEELKKKKLQEDGNSSLKRKIMNKIKKLLQ